MMQAGLHPTPRLRDVLLEHVRILGLALRTMAVVAAALLVVSTLLVINETPRQNAAIAFHPDRYLLPAFLGMVFPIVVWRGEDRFGSGLLWAAPVGHRGHALTKVMAGWIWLMGTIGLFVIWLIALSAFTGGSFLAEEAIRVLSVVPPPFTVADPDSVRVVRRAAQPLLWLSPFTAATGAYLLASAAALGLRHPFRSIVAMALGLQLFIVAGDAVNTLLPRRLVAAIYAGPYGIDTLLSARSETARVWVSLPMGELIHVWRASPTVSQWAMGTLLWTGVGAVMLWVAVSRRRELTDG